MADALSKVHVSEGKNTDDATVELSAISYPYFGWIDELRRHNEKDEWVKEKFKEVSDCISRGNTTPSLAKYSIDNGFLCYKRIVVLSPSSQWKHKILEEHHSTPVAGHQGVVKAYHQIKKGFYWQGLKKMSKSSSVSVLCVNRTNSKPFHHQVSYNPYQFHSKYDMM